MKPFPAASNGVCGVKGRFPGSNAEKGGAWGEFLAGECGATYEVAVGRKAFPPQEDGEDEARKNQNAISKGKGNPGALYNPGSMPSTTLGSNRLCESFASHLAANAALH